MARRPDKSSKSLPSDIASRNIATRKKRKLTLDNDSPSVKSKMRKQPKPFDRPDKKTLTDKHKKLKSKRTTSERKKAIARKQQQEQSYFDVPEFGTVNSEEEEEEEELIEVESAEEESDVEVVDLSDEVNEDEESDEVCSMQELKNGARFMKLPSSPKNNRALLIHLHPSASFQFTGKARIHVLNGSVEVYGHHFHKNTPVFDIFSQRQQTTIQCICSNEPKPNGNLCDNKDLIESIKRQVPKFNRLMNIGSVLVLEAFETEWSLGFRSLVGNDRRKLIGEWEDAEEKVNVAEVEDPFVGLGFQLHSESEEDFELQIPPAWTDLYEEIALSGDPKEAQAGRLAIFGPQSSGKSTLTKWMTNKLLNHFESVLYVDLDPGQPEFTPPGAVSIVKCVEPVFGPNYTHLTQPVQSVFIGTINVADSPLTYLNAIQQLANFIKINVDLQNLPIIVNMIGFTKGLGLDLTVEVIKMFQLTTVVQLSLSTKVDYELDLVPNSVSKYKSSFKTSVEGILNYRFHKIDSVYKCHGEMQIPFLDRKKQREYLVLSYFASLVKEGRLNSCVPYTVPLSAIKIGLENEAIPGRQESLGRILNGSLVALGNFENSGQASDNDSSWLKSFIGYGLVRAIDTTQELLYILTPIPVGILKDVNYLVSAGNTLGIPLQLLNNFNSNTARAERPYMMSPHKHRINSRLHTITKKYFAPNRVATHSLLKRCLL